MSRARALRGGALAALLLATAATAPTGAAAQPGPGTFPFGRPPLSPPAPLATTPSRAAAQEAPRSLHGRFGVDVAERLLRSPAISDKLRGIARASALASPEAIALLARAAEPGGDARSDARTMLEVARALAPFADNAAARSGLVALMAASSPTPGPRASSAPARAHSDARTRDAEGDGDADPRARATLARQVAALALATSDDAQALEALAVAARSSGPAQPVAIFALSVYAPTQIGGFMGGTPTAPLVRLAADVGDLRALDALRAAVRASDAATRAAAITALGDMRDMRGIEAARALAADPDVRVRVAATEALVALDAPDRARAVEALVAHEATALAGARLAERVQDDGVVKALAALAVASGDYARRSAAVVALGRQTSREAVRVLVVLVRDPTLAGDVADALARSPSGEAWHALEELAGAIATRRLAVRAYMVRALARGPGSDALARAAVALADSREGRDRAVGAMVLIALGERPLGPALADPDPRVRRAAAMATLARGDRDELRALLARLDGERDATTRTVLAIGLLGGDADGAVSTFALAARADAHGPEAALAARALASRSDEAQYAKVTALLTARDPVLRAHVALGLGESTTRDAVGKLAGAYRFETDVTVRRAVVAALAARAGGRDARAPERLATLRTAARLDPDRVVRGTARRALAGMPTADVTRSPLEVAWLRAATMDGTAAPVGLTGAVVRADGVAVPIAFDDDGYALVAGMPPGDARLVLAPRLSTYEGPPP